MFLFFLYKDIPFHLKNLTFNFDSKNIKKYTKSSVSFLLLFLKRIKNVSYDLFRNLEGVLGRLRTDKLLVVPPFYLRFCFIYIFFKKRETQADELLH